MNTFIIYWGTDFHYIYENFYFLVVINNLLERNIIVFPNNNN